MEKTIFDNYGIEYNFAYALPTITLENIITVAGGISYHTEKRENIRVDKVIIYDYLMIIYSGAESYVIIEVDDEIKIYEYLNKHIIISPNTNEYLFISPNNSKKVLYKEYRTGFIHGENYPMNELCTFVNHDNKLKDSPIKAVNILDKTLLFTINNNKLYINEIGDDNVMMFDITNDVTDLYIRDIYKEETEVGELALVLSDEKTIIYIMISDEVGIVPINGNSFFRIDLKDDEFINDIIMSQQHMYVVYTNQAVNTYNRAALTMNKPEVEYAPLKDGFEEFMDKVNNETLQSVFSNFIDRKERFNSMIDEFNEEDKQ